ncbi:MAG: glycosyltransferase family 39 protein [Xanthobacteraceae bacterium]|nr:glycosyltransferase family 39 protein [Xanthobacteraceae bacterium]
MTERAVPRQILVLALTLAVPFVLALTVFPTPMYDTRELMAWGRHFPLVTPDHPPLMSWIGGAVDRLFGGSAASAVAANQLLMAVGLAYFHASLRVMMAPAAAALFTLIYGASFYTALGALSFALNADILQLTSWPAVVFHLLHAQRTNRWPHWVGLGVWTAIALLTKYNAVVLLVGLGVAVLAVGDFRVVLRRPGLYGAAALALALVSIHVAAVLERGAAVGYALARFDVEGLSGRIASLGQLVLGHVGLLMPGLVVVAVGAWRGFLALDRSAPSAEQRLLLITNATMQVILLGLVLVAGLDYVFRYSAPYAMMAVLALAPWFRPAGAWRDWAGRELVAALGALYVALGLGIAIVYTLFASHSPMQEPTADGARAILAAWDRSYACGPAYFIGGRQDVYGVGLQAGDRVDALFYRDIAGAPWFDRDRLSAGGAVVIDTGPDYERRMARFLPGVPLAPEAEVTLPLLRTHKPKTFTYHYHFVAPQGCGQRGDLRRAGPS